MLLTSMVLAATLVGLPQDISPDGKRMIMTSPEGSILTIIDEEGVNSRGDVVKEVRSISVYKEPLDYEGKKVSGFIEITVYNCRIGNYMLKEGILIDRDQRVIAREKMDRIITPEKDTPGMQELEFVCKNSKRKVVPNV
jgi:hypothetical protein